MNHSLLATVAAFTLSATAAMAAPIVIDFDTSDGGVIANGTVLSTQYAGVTFSGTENGLSVASPIATSDYTAEFGGAPVSGNVLQNQFDSGARADEITISFASAVSGISFDFIPFGDLGPNSTITVFGLGGLLYNDVIGGPAATDVNFNYTDIAGLVDVTSFVIGQPTDNWAWGLDNLTYSAAAVPLPAALPMLFMALGGLGVAARRRKTS